MAESKNTKPDAVTPINVNLTPEEIAEDAAFEATKPKSRTREDGGKQVGAWFSPVEYAALRKARFRHELDRDSDLIRAAVAAYVAEPESDQS
jgi:hypothetical protein